VQNDVNELETLLTEDIIYLIADTLTLIGNSRGHVDYESQAGIDYAQCCTHSRDVLVIWQKYARVAFIRVRQQLQWS